MRCHRHNVVASRGEAASASPSRRKAPRRPLRRDESFLECRTRLSACADRALGTSAHTRLPDRDRVSVARLMVTANGSMVFTTA
jgi:hypothetical protein